MRDIVIVRLIDDEETSYEVRDENNSFLADRLSFEDALEVAAEIAAAHDLDDEYIKVRVRPEEI